LTEPTQPATPGPSPDEGTSGTREPATDLTPSPVGTPPSRPGARTFTIEGRAAPGLFLVGWLGSLIGIGLIVVAALAAPGTIKTILVIVGLAALGPSLVAAAGSQALQRRAAGAAYAGPSPFLVFAAVIPLTSLIAILVFRPLVALGLSTDAPLATLLGVLIQVAVYVGLLRLLVVGTGALTWSDMGFARPPNLIPRDAASGVVLAFPVLAVTLVLAVAFVGLLGTRPQPILPPSTSGTDLLLNLVTAAAIAPIGEETFFRGFATTAWAPVYGPTRAIVQGALFFAFVHVLTIGAADFSDGTRQALIAFVVRVPVALALGWLFLRRRSIYAPMGLHATFNAIAVLLSQP
jgi:membrane protease YdiL (CAAX protease family)